MKDYYVDADVSSDIHSTANDIKRTGTLYSRLTEALSSYDNMTKRSDAWYLKGKKNLLVIKLGRVDRRMVELFVPYCDKFPENLEDYCATYKWVKAQGDWKVHHTNDVCEVTELTGINSRLQTGIELTFNASTIKDLFSNMDGIITRVINRSHELQFL